MRILFSLLEAPLPPFNGLRLQLFHLVRELHARNDIRVVGYRMPEQAEDPDDAWMRLLPRPSLGVLGRARYLASATARGQALGVEELAGGLREAFREEVEAFRPDVVHVSSGELALLAREYVGLPSVIAALDSWYLGRKVQVSSASGLKRLLLKEDTRRVRHFEATEYRRFDRVVVVSEEDREALSELDPSLAIEVIPNGVDLEAFRPDPAGPRDPHRIVFHGLMRFAPNVTAVEFLARRILPRVRSVDPAAHLQIVGRSPSPAVVALGRLPGVEVTGEVPDVRPYLTAARVYCCPMRSGSGIKNKLLEALACGLPCVVTPLALGGMAPVPGRDLLVGADEEELAGHLLRILQEDAAAEDLGRAGRAYVQAHHSWEAVGRTYERLYADVVSRSTSGTGTA